MTALLEYLPVALVIAVVLGCLWLAAGSGINALDVPPMKERDVHVPKEDL